jgi:hypothetical protein
MLQTTITDVLVTHVEALAQQLTYVLPWVKQLTEAERVELLADLAHACTHIRHTGQTQALLEVLEDWEATAHLVQDSHLMAHLQATATQQDTIPWEVVRADVPGHPAS